jgi:NTP pyrophosphatase (non-canonical NTP hydrolase)
MTDEQKAICHKIADHYGEKHQMLKAVEEMAELTQAIVKTVHGDTLHEWDYPSELADVLIMVEQLQYMYDKSDGVFDGRVERFIDAKLSRQLKRMEGYADER